MAKYLISIVAVLFFFSNCFADTFTHRQTGKSFNGYATQIKRHNTTQVRIENKTRPQYLDLGDYEIHYNHLGRKNKVSTFSIKEPIDLICEAEAFEEAILLAADHGPLFILIEIDTSGGRIDLAKRICGAIIQIDNCRTVAFVNGGKFDGAYSTGAAIAIACDELYMADNTTIGGATLVSYTPSDLTNVRRRRVRTSRRPYGRPIVEKPIVPSRPDDDASTLTAYIAALAEKNNRPAVIAKAMVDESIEAIEVTEGGETLFVAGQNKKATQTLVRTWSERGSLLTLTAAEAVHCNIADKIVSSQRELLAALDAAKAGLVRNNDCEKAKRGFGRARQDFNEISPAITHLKGRSEELHRELNMVESLTRGRGPLYGYRSYWYERDAIERQRLRNELLFTLDRLILNYRRAIQLANEYLDLNADIDSLVEGMNSAIVKFEEVRRRPPM
jgi:membrane-bound ClpP family serine protease